MKKNLMFDEVLKNYRVRTGMTQQQMVERLNEDSDFSAVSTISYHRWESGKVTPSVKKQARILLILDDREALRTLCQDCLRSVKFLEVTIKRRWDVRRFGFDYCYDEVDSKVLTFERLESWGDIPTQALQLQDTIYANRTKHILSDAKHVMMGSTFNYLMLAHHNEHFFGQLGFHVINAKALLDYFEHMKYDKVNTFNSLSVKDEDEVVFLSAFHSTRKDVFIRFLKNLVEALFELDTIPKYTYLRLYAGSLNTLIESQLMPRLVNKGGTTFPRLKHVNQEYEWLGYLVPTHLILLTYGAILTSYKLEIEQSLSLYD